MPRIAILDSYYPDVIRAIPFDDNSTYEKELRKVLDVAFGTGDFYGRALTALGWDCVDLIVNHDRLQEMWAREHGNPQNIVAAQIEAFKPDVIFLQDASLSLPDSAGNITTAAQISCPWPGYSSVEPLDVVFTSFPHYVERLEDLGVRAIYNPLAFEPSVLDRCPFCKGRGSFDMAVDYEPYVQGSKCSACDGRGHHAKYPKERIHDVVFIGGVGNPSHWRYGMEVLETVAREIPTFKWWGYGFDTLPADSALRGKYQGQAFGLDMYEILLQSKICLNRHGEVAEGYANNMRLFESTGCGALLLTEQAPNLYGFFSEDEVLTYGSPMEAVYTIRGMLKDPEAIRDIAANGQARTLRDHAYAQRMKVVSSVLKEMLVHA